jgi:hypothetical protein
VADFPLFIDGNPVTSGIANTVTVGTHTASETTQAGYAASLWGGDCNTDGTITLALGDDKTCSITNDDTGGPATLNVCKIVINDDSGTAVPSDFTMTVTGNNPIPASFPGDENCTTVTIDAGSYSVSESGPSGYTQSKSADCSGTIAGGDNKTCTITNNDGPPPVGGMVEINVTNGTPGSSSASEATADSPWARGYLLGTIAAAAALIAAGGWYARWRWLA